MAWYEVAAVLFVGFAAGFINTISGSGSLLTLPLLVFLGLPAPVANGTNRISIFFQTGISSWGFWRKKVLKLRTGLILALPATAGAALGAFLAVDINEQLMKKAIGLLLILMSLLILSNPQRWFKQIAPVAEIRNGPWQWVLLFLTGVYGGFIQAGVGLILLPVLVLGARMDVKAANAVKNFIVLCFTVVALAIFFRNGQVSLLPGLMLALGSSVGAWWAVRFAVRKSPAFISYFLLLMVLVSALHLLGVFEMLKKMTA